MGIEKYASEREFQKAIIEYAELKGWMVYAVIDRRNYAKRTSKGFPDLTLVRYGRLVFAELKSSTGKLSFDQEKWIKALTFAGKQMLTRKFEVYVWWPKDYDDILEILK